MKKIMLLVALLMILALPGAALADVISPGTKRISVYNYVTLDGDFSDYEFYFYDGSSDALTPLDFSEPVPVGYRFAFGKSYFAVPAGTDLSAITNYDIQWNALSAEQQAKELEDNYQMQILSDENAVESNVARAKKSIAIQLYAKYDSEPIPISFEYLNSINEVSASSTVESIRVDYVLRQQEDGSFAGEKTGVEKTKEFNWLFLLVILLPLAGVIQVIFIIRRRKHV